MNVTSMYMYKMTEKQDYQQLLFLVSSEARGAFSTSKVIEDWLSAPVADLEDYKQGG